MKKGSKIFFIGIGGVGMSAIAHILNQRGYKIIGSDRSESRMTKILAGQGIDVRIGHDSANITSDIDLVVHTNAVGFDNPEMKAAHELGIPIIERAIMLNQTASTKFSIGISGTHGKTSTTSMLSKIFLKAGVDPSLAVGGYLEEAKGSGYEGKGNYFIYEACEAFGSMLNMYPDISVVTNIDSDHLDYYGTLANIRAAFRKFFSENIPPYGIVIYNKDDQNLREVIRDARPFHSVSVGIRHKDADFTAERITLGGFHSEFTIKRRGKSIGRFKINVPGIHNVYNSLLAAVAAHLSGISTKAIQASLSEFENAKRRFQLKHREEALTVIDDYAHHPSEIKATLMAARKLADKQSAHLIAVFQPHLYSRTEALYKDFAKALSKADTVVLTEIYAAREENVNNISAQIIYDEVVKHIGEENVLYADTLPEVPKLIQPYLTQDSIVITLGAGDVWKVSEMFSDTAAVECK